MMNGIFKMAAIAAVLLGAALAHARDRWTPEQANEWFAKQPYRAGVNYVPSYAINSIEVWSKETFNPEIIDNEFALMQSIGMNAVRVFLNELIWEADSEGFYKRVDKFLDIAQKHNIGVMFVFFTNGGKDGAKLGKQPEPNGTHNSGWFKQPRLSIFRDKTKWSGLEKYVKQTITRYANDKRVLVWDIYNEPGNIKSPHIKGGAGGLTAEEVETLTNISLDFLKANAQWGRSCNPSQPITFGAFYQDSTPHGKRFNSLIYAESDIISFHCYGDLRDQLAWLKALNRQNRPIMCTEWMARISGSSFNPILKFMKNHNIWSFSFGLVAGKIETWRHVYTEDCPELQGIWFHDIFKADHTPYEPTEVEYIKSVLKN